MSKEPEPFEPRDPNHDHGKDEIQHALPIYRRIIKLGHSHAITLPPAWIRRHVERYSRVVILVTKEDGTITIYPFHQLPLAKSLPADSAAPNHRRR